MIYDNSGKKLMKLEHTTDTYIYRDNWYIDIIINSNMYIAYLYNGNNYDVIVKEFLVAVPKSKSSYENFIEICTEEVEEGIRQYKKRIKKKWWKRK